MLRALVVAIACLIAVPAFADVPIQMKLAPVNGITNTGLAPDGTLLVPNVPLREMCVGYFIELNAPKTVKLPIKLSTVIIFNSGSNYPLTVLPGVGTGNFGDPIIRKRIFYTTTGETPESYIIAPHSVVLFIVIAYGANAPLVTPIPLS